MLCCAGRRCDDARVRSLAGWVIAGVLVCIGVCASVAYGGGSGGARSRLLTSRDAFATEAQVAVGPGGAAVAVWNQDGRGVVLSTRRRLTGGWIHPKTLEKVVGFQTTFGPQVVVARSGAAAVVWQAYSDTARQPIEAVSRRSASARWTAPTVIAYGALWTPKSLGMDDRGHALLVYVSRPGTRAQRIDAIRLNAQTGRWGRPVALGRSRSDLAEPTVAVDADGRAVAAWSIPRRVRHKAHWVPGVYRTDSWVQATVMRDGRWTTPERLGQETQIQYDPGFDATPNGPEVAIDSRGRAIVVWQHSPSGQRLIADAATLGAHATRWLALSSPSRGEAFAPQVASSRAGWVTLAWETSRGAIATRSGPITGCCWSPTTTLPGSSARFDFDLSLVGGPGHAAALDYARVSRPIQLLIHPSASSSMWEKPIAVGRKPNHRFSDPIPLSLAVNPAGQLLTVWTQEGSVSSSGLVHAPLHATTASER